MRVALGEDGMVALGPTDAHERAILETVPFVQAGRCWWTYLPDLRAAIPGPLALEAGTRERLQARVARTNALRACSAKTQDWLAGLFAPGVRPYPFQFEGIAFGLRAERFLLADQVGLGKSIQSLGIMLGAFRLKRATHAVIVCPTGLRDQWRQEIERFASPALLEPQDVVVVDGPPDARRRAYKRPWRVLLASPDVIRHDYPILKPYAGQIGFWILDEASSIKNPDNKNARALRALAAPARYRIALTATPVENRLLDLFSILAWAEPRAFPSREYFEARYVAKWKVTTFPVYRRVPVRYHRLDEVQAKIRPCYLRRRVDEVGLQMPGLAVKWETVRFGPDQQAVYGKAREAARTDLAVLTGRGSFADDNLPASLVTLRQACDSTALVREPDPTPASAKLDRLLELVRDELAGEPTLVFTDYARMARLIVPALEPEGGAAVYDGQTSRKARQEAIDAWRAGTIRHLVATRAGERGLNLQTGACIINFDLPWNPAALKQRIGRLRRVGSGHALVRCLNLIVAGTVEETVVRRLIYSKRQVFEAVFGQDELSNPDPVGRRSAGV